MSIRLNVLAFTVVLATAPLQAQEAPYCADLQQIVRLAAASTGNVREGSFHETSRPLPGWRDCTIHGDNTYACHSEDIATAETAEGRLNSVVEQVNASRAPFDQLAEIVDAVGDRIDVMMDGGIQRGTHILKALSLGAKAVGVGRFYLYPLAATGQPGVERALGLMRAEIERGMKLMGCTSISQLSRGNLRFR